MTQPEPRGNQPDTDRGDPRARGRALARESIERGDPTGWFERLYVESQRDGTPISWVDLAPNPYLVEWLERRHTAAQPQPERPTRPQRPLPGRALVVGCGYGDDAELLADSGFHVTAFDVAPSAIARCRERFPNSGVEYVVADALEPPAEWTGAFDFVFEAYTVQVLPSPFRARCAAAIGRFVAPGGVLLVVARSRGAADPEGAMPWPLTRSELDDFLVPGLELAHLADIMEPGDPPVPRFVAEFVRG